MLFTLNNTSKAIFIFIHPKGKNINEGAVKINTSVHLFSEVALLFVILRHRLLI